MLSIVFLPWEYQDTREANLLFNFAKDHAGNDDEDPEQIDELINCKSLSFMCEV